MRKTNNEPSGFAEISQPSCARGTTVSCSHHDGPAAGFREVYGIRFRAYSEGHGELVSRLMKLAGSSFCLSIPYGGLSKLWSLFGSPKLG